MANETEAGNFVTPTDVVSRVISPALVKGPVALPLIHMEPVPERTAIRKFRKQGNLVGAEVSESGSWSYGAGSELTQSSVSATATKFACVTKLTVEAKRFTPEAEDIIMEEQVAAVLRDCEDEVLALFDNFSNQVTATSTLTTTELLDAQYNVVNGVLRAGSGMQRAVLDPKALKELASVIVTSGAAVWSQSDMVSILRNLNEPNGFAGSYMGIDLYRQVGLPTDSGDDVGLVFDPAIAFGAIMDPAPEFFNTNVVSGGFWTEMSTYWFFDVIEWNDLAGCGIKSDS